MNAGVCPRHCLQRAGACHGVGESFPLWARLHRLATRQSMSAAASSRRVGLQEAFPKIPEGTGKARHTYKQEFVLILYVR